MTNLELIADSFSSIRTIRVRLVHMIGRRDMIELSYPASICCLVHQ